MNKRMMILVLGFALGCQGKPAPHAGTQWNRVGPSAEPLESARTACHKEALEKTKNIAQESAATQAAAGIFIECMRRNGWVQAGGGTR